MSAINPTMDGQLAALPVALLDRRQAAAWLTERGYKIAVATLAKLACLGGGPLFRSFGRKPLYHASDLLAWAEGRTSGPRRSTSEAV